MAQQPTRQLCPSESDYGDQDSVETHLRNYGGSRFTRNQPESLWGSRFNRNPPKTDYRNQDSVETHLADITGNKDSIKEWLK
jgi:hypothetical protein